MTSSKNRGKYLSYLLRHHPEEVGCTLDEYGWCDVNTLISNSDFTIGELETLVSEGTRYELSNDKSKIRSFHGHSVPGIIYQDELTESIPLYHGTSRDTLEEIKRVGAILPMSRVQVHLSKDMNKAKEVGGRHGSPVIIVIDTEKMLKDNLKIYSSGDGVYLTDSVPVEYFKEILNKHFETEIN